MAWPATVPRWHPACFAGLLAAALGCDATQDDDYRLRLDLSHCVAQDEQPDGCRMRLRALAPPGLAACLVIRPLDDPSRTHHLSLVWDAAQLVPTDGAPPPTLLPGEVVHAALFALAAPAPDCTAVDLEAECAPGACAARFGPVERRIAPSGTTILDFRSADGDCAGEVAGRDEPGGALNEVCGDGIDNDCDGIADEPLAVPCRVGIGACENVGVASACVDGRWRCDAVPLAASVDADCNGIDDDCDGRIDEAGDCGECLFDNECLATPARPQCVGGVCRACDPSDDAGCGPEAPVCDAANQTCRPCRADAECPGALCVGGHCRACDPARMNSCPNPGEPTCDPESFTCRPCLDGAECASGTCFGGRCATCDPGTHAGCAAPEVVCDLDTLACRRCEADAECRRADPAHPICRDGACVECNPLDDSGCDGGQPICIEENGTPPRCASCVEDAECPTGQCRTGRCVGCDPVDDSGCDPLGGQPVCDEGEGDGAFCRACRQDVECRDPTRRFCVGGACQPCDPATGAGCEPDGATPVCVAGVCQRCDADEQCVATVGAGSLCLDDGRCGPCDPVGSRGCRIGSAQPVCDAFSLICRRCNFDAECPVGNCDVISGRCEACDPAGADCDIASAQPICDPQDLACRACVEGSNDCGGNIYGTVCRAGVCGCDPGDANSCVWDSNRPVCDAAEGRCRACGGNVQCRENPNGGHCLGDGRCRVCDITDYREGGQRYAGCDDANPICVRDGEACVPRCDDDGDCIGGTTCQDNGDGRTGCQ